MNKPRYNVCDHCGRNAHKVALRIPAPKPFRTATRVVGLCPSCFEGALTPQKWWPEGRVPFENATLVYDRRGERSRKQTPVPEHLTS